MCEVHVSDLRCGCRVASGVAARRFGFLLIAFWGGRLRPFRPGRRGGGVGFRLGFSLLTPRPGLRRRPRRARRGSRMSIRLFFISVVHGPPGRRGLLSLYAPSDHPAPHPIAHQTHHRTAVGAPHTAPHGTSVSAYLRGLPAMRFHAAAPRRDPVAWPELGDALVRSPPAATPPVVPLLSWAGEGTAEVATERSGFSAMTRNALSMLDSRTRPQEPVCSPSRHPANWMSSSALHLQTVGGEPDATRPKRSHKKAASMRASQSPIVQPQAISKRGCWKRVLPISSASGESVSRIHSSSAVTCASIES